MKSTHWRFMKAFVVLFALIFSAFATSAQTSSVAPRITQAIDEGNLVTLKGTTHALARAQFDRGAVSDGLVLDRLQLVLQRSPQQEAALTALIAQQQEKSSANYHKWLTPEQFGQRFGVASADIETVTGWLEQHSFTVTNVSNGRTVIEFSGTAGLVRVAFHTEIHNFVVNGENHIANASNLQIPAALAPVVAGVASLHNFFPRSQLTRTGAHATVPYSPGKPVTHLTFGPGEYGLGPADFAVIYNVQPAYTDSITGTGRTIATLGVSDITATDVSDFDTVFGLPGGNWSVVHNGTDPGITSSGDQTESTLDNEWAGAIGYGATIKFVVSKTTTTTFGTDLSAQYVVDNNVADIMTVSYGACEAQEPSSYISLENSIAQQAAAEGITYTAAAGDAGAEDCDDPSTESVATGPISVDLPGSTPYTVSVGGTEFNEGSNDNLYWSTSTSAYPSALSYIPEEVWNESCKSGQTGCTTPAIFAGGGGVSQSFALPTWQQGFNVPAAPNAFIGRGVPDVSLSAAGHDGYAVCISGGCVANSQGEVTLEIVGGTSAASPSFASIMSLVDQHTNSRQGPADTVLYALAQTETFASCNGSATPALTAGSGCIFNDTTTGNNAVPGETGYGTSTADWQAGVGWDPATGLGSVNVNNLITDWTSSGTPTASFGVSAAAASPSMVSPGSSATSTVTVSATNGFSGSVTLSCTVAGTSATDTDIPTCAVTGTNPVTLSSTTTSATSTIKVSTTGSSALMRFPGHGPFNGGLLALASAIALACLFAFGAPVRKRQWSALAAVLLFAALMGLAACGGGGSSSGNSSTGTSADTYTVTVTATSGSASQTSSFTVTVN
jgi:subtilase family serine protease